jgi:hypothetical protein
MTFVAANSSPRMTAIRYLEFGIIAHGPENVLSGGRDNLHLGGAVSSASNFCGLARDNRGLVGTEWVSWVALIVAGGLAIFGFRFTANDED